MSYEPPGYPPQPPYGPQPPGWRPPVVSGVPAQPYSAPPQGFPPPQYYGAPPPPPQPPVKKSSPLKIVLITAAFVVGGCLILGAVANFAGNSPSSTSVGKTDAGETDAGKTDGEAVAAPPTAAKTPAKPKAAPKKQAGIGSAVRDGKFEFVVTDLDCSKTTLGNEFLNTKAQGRYCVVTVSVKNIGDEAQLFAGSNQKAYDAKGAEFTNDGGAEFYANDNNETFLNDINPGNKVTGKVVFDVPKGTVLKTVELHDSFWSGGVKVTLA